MCLPLAPLIAIGAAVATSAISVVGQIQSANSANKAIKAQLAVRDHEIDLAASHEINDRLRQARREQARIVVAAGESGLSLESGSVNALLQDAQMQATLSNQTSLANRESRRDAARAEANASMRAKPTVLGAGLQIGLAGLNAASASGAFRRASGDMGAATTSDTATPGLSLPETRSGAHMREVREGTWVPTPKGLYFLRYGETLPDQYRYR